MLMGSHEVGDGEGAGVGPSAGPWCAQAGREERESSPEAA